MFYHYLFFISMVSSMRPNFVLILTDDQDVLLDGLKPMRNTLKSIANEGVFFEHSYANSPICCPSRSSLLTGRYAHNLNVYNNSVEGNCSSPDWQRNHESRTITSLLKRADYTTFYAGKYLNRYGDKRAGGLKHVPEGVDWWFGLEGNSKYYDYALSINGTKKKYRDEYLTDVIASHALDFLDSRGDGPFFLVAATPAPHSPFVPALRHRGSFRNVTASRTPSFNYSSEGKHWIVGMPPEYLPNDVTNLDEIQRKRMQTLLAVDELVEQLIEKTKSIGVYENTYFIFTSDNGYHIGQFGQPWDKRQPYETDVRVPLMISGPRVMKKIVSDYPVSLVDLAPTIIDLAGLSVPDYMDGESFKNHLFEPNSDRNKSILIEYWGEGDADTIDPECPYRSDELAECTTASRCKCQDSRNNTYSCFVRFARSSTVKFCKFRTGFTETYNLIDDPYELKNLRGHPDHYSGILRGLMECSGTDCRTRSDDFHV